MPIRSTWCILPYSHGRHLMGAIHTRVTGSIQNRSSALHGEWKAGFKESKQPAQGPTGIKGYAKIPTYIYRSWMAVLSAKQEEVSCHKALRQCPECCKKEQEMDDVIISLLCLDSRKQPKATMKHGAVSRIINSWTLSCSWDDRTNFRQTWYKWWTFLHII